MKMADTPESQIEDQVSKSLVFLIQPLRGGLLF